MSAPPPARSPTPTASATRARISAALLVVFFAGMCWLTLLNDGVTVKGRSGATAFATGGAAALAMVGLWLLAASLGLLLWLRA